MTLDKRDFPGATFPEWMHKYTSKRARPMIGPQAFTIVTAGLYLRGNPLPYFSVMSETWERSNARDCISCGCQHDEVAKLWPKLKPIIALHLSDSDGVPMHATANSWYQLAGYYGGASECYHAGNSQRHIYDSDGKYVAYRNPTPDECLQSFADYVRLSFEDAKALAEGWQHVVSEQPEAVKRWFSAWVEAQRPRWKQEAEAGCKLLDKLIARQTDRDDNDEEDLPL